MKWLVVGVSEHSKGFVEELLNQGEEVSGVLSRSLDKARAFSKKYNIVNVFDDINNVVDFDVAYIAIPNGFHYKYSKYFLEHGKHVFVEKVMTNTFNETKELFDLAESKKLKIMEGYAHIARPDVIKLKGSDVEANLMSPVLSWKTNDKDDIADIPTFRRDMGGGALRDIGCYTLSLGISILGNVKEFKVSKIQFLNDVEAELFLETTHESGNMTSYLSLLREGNNVLKIDGELIHGVSHYGDVKNRLSHEIINFVSGNQLEYFKNISLEVARLIDEIDELIIKKKLAH